MKSLHQPEEIIAQRYRILNKLGQGGVGITYQALDLNTNEKVALKVLSLRRMTDWKKMELFEREAQILSQLNHPAIPNYLDYFQVDTPTDRSFYIAQQLAPGKSLDELVENGWRPDENEVKQLAIKLLEILAYLQSLTPPVIHRDIKPQNIILNSDKQVFLVDFGAVQDTYHNTVTGGSTIVGTFGYMAPEQFRGQAVLSTDLYGLGTTILFLLTGKSPADLPSRKLKINFRSQVQVSARFANWLEKMLSPVIEDRFPSAAAALAVLQGQEPLSNYANQKIDKPENSKITLTKTDKKLIIKIPSKSLHDDRNQYFALFLLVWNCLLFYPLLYSFYNGIERIWNVTGISNVDIIIYIILGISLIILGISLRINYRNIFSIGAVLWNIGTLSIDLVVAVLNKNIVFYFGIWIVLIDLFLVFWIQRDFLISLKRKIELEITPNNFQIRFSLIKRNCKTFENSTELIKPILSFLCLPMDEQPLTDLFLRDELLDYRFHSLLNQAEKEWLAKEITDFLQKVQK